MKTATTSVLIAGVIGAATLATAPPSIATTPPVNANSGASWLSSQLKNGRIPSTWTPGTTDWGLTADTIFAMTSRRVAGDAANSATDALASSVLKYISPTGGASRSAGGVAKSLLVAVTAGRNAESFGGQNLVATLESMQSNSGANAGRYSDLGTTSDYSSAFSQSLAIIALARLGRLSAPSVTFLLNMQCANGGFPYSPSFTTSRCDSNADVDNDASSMVVQALSAPGVAAIAGVPQAKAAAVAYLKGAQKPSGAFDSPPWISDNASTTGLAAQALRLGGQTAAANKSTQWLTNLTLTCANAGAAKAHVGAIAADPATFTSIKSGGVTTDKVDQLRRSTSQGVFGFADTDSFVTMSHANAVAAAPQRTCPVPPSRPKLVSIHYAADMRSAVVNFSGGSNELLVRNRNTRNTWGPWRSLKSRTQLTVSTPSVLQAVTRRAGLDSVPLTTSVAAARAQGMLRGCPAIGAVVVRYPNAGAGVLTFAKRTNACAAVSTSAGSPWRTVKPLQGTVVVPLRNGASVVRFRTGSQVIVINLVVPR